MNNGHTINVLDHGYVKLIDRMGRDEDIIEAARMSTSGGFVSWEPYEGHPRGDAGLLEFLKANNHATPTEMCEVVFEVKCPIMVVWEWVRHRTLSYNIESGRYTQLADEHYIPTAERIKSQGKSNKQGSEGEVDPNTKSQLRFDMMQDQGSVYYHYEWALKNGVAREIARLNTPMSRYTKMRVKGNLRNWFQFLKLRLEENAQYEIRVFAQAVAECIRALFPRSYGLFEEYDLNAVTFSQREMRALHDIAYGIHNEGFDDFEGLEPRYANQLRRKLGIPGY